MHEVLYIHTLINIYVSFVTLGIRGKMLMQLGPSVCLLFPQKPPATGKVPGGAPLVSIVLAIVLEGLKVPFIDQQTRPSTNGQAGETAVSRLSVLSSHFRRISIHCSPVDAKRAGHMVCTYAMHDARLRCSMARSWAFAHKLEADTALTQILYVPW